MLDRPGDCRSIACQSPWRILCALVAGCLIGWGAAGREAQAGCGNYLRLRGVLPDEIAARTVRSEGPAPRESLPAPPCQGPRCGRSLPGTPWPPADSSPDRYRSGDREHFLTDMVTLVEQHLWGQRRQPAELRSWRNAYRERLLDPPRDGAV